MYLGHKKEKIAKSNYQDVLKEKLKNIPKYPGIYKFLDKSGKIIYIGKSVNLKGRVNSYFNGKSRLNFAKQKMVNEIIDIETIITDTSGESIILETTLIKENQPKYNILMKDDKNHIYIKITDETIPRIQKTRISPRDGNKKSSGTYFGPYISTNYVNNILKLMKKIFGYRSCDLKFINKSVSSKSLPLEERELNKDLIYSQERVKNLENDCNNFLHENLPKPLYQGGIKISGKSNIKIPCIDYYIRRCAGPCLLEMDKIENYQKSIKNIKSFLKGNYGDVLENLENKMKKLAKDLRFEEAQKIKEDINSIKSLDNHQIVRDFVSGDYDIVNLVQKYNKNYIGFIQIREGKIINFKNTLLENNLDETKEELISYFLENNYSMNEKKIIIILPFALPDLSKDFLNLSNISIEVPKIGPKVEVLRFAYRNAYDYAYREHIASLATKGFTKKTHQNILDLLGYKQINKDIVFECYDISHLGGTHTVASRSVIENGKTNPSKYRKYKVKTLEEGKIDDFGSMREVLGSRIKEINKTGFIPDLIIIDGGKGQLGAVVEELQLIISKGQENIDVRDISQKHLYDGENVEKFRQNISTESIQIVSIAKREEELFLPGEKESIILDKDSDELRLVQKARDEAHRFAITFNRDSRSKSMKKNILESLPGFGSKTRQKVLKRFGSFDQMIEASREDLAEVLSISQIETLENHGII